MTTFDSYTEKLQESDYLARSAVSTDQLAETRWALDRELLHVAEGQVSNIVVVVDSSMDTSSEVSAESYC